MQREISWSYLCRGTWVSGRVSGGKVSGRDSGRVSGRDSGRISDRGYLKT